MTVNPCPTCVSLDPCATCLPRLAYEGAQPDPEPTRCATCEDAEWLSLAGEQPEQIAARLGYRDVHNLAAHLRRHGAPPMRRTA